MYKRVKLHATTRAAVTERSKVPEIPGWAAHGFKYPQDLNPVANLCIYGNIRTV